MRRIYSALSLLLLSVLFFQCQREVSFVGGPDFPGQIATPDPITAALQGNVFDETGTPAQGVTVQVGSKIATTNVNGYFRINDAPLDKKSSKVTASKAGYFTAYRTFAATSGANNVIIKLIKRDLAGTIDGAAGGEVALANGSKVALPANGVVNAATNAAYTGSVRVYAAYIDPTATDFDQFVPGSLMANDKDGKRVTLTSFGMMAVELESTSGEKLQIKTGAKATLTTAIPAATQSGAPATIPLWYVDETTGIWQEQGSATKSGNVYVGEVSHFSFWNCDVSQNALLISMRLQLNGGESLVGATVRLNVIGGGWGWSSYGYTDSIGQVSGYIPYNTPLKLEVLDRCYNVIYSQNIGPYTQNTNLGSVTVPSSSTAVLTIKGKLVDCTNAPVTNGYAYISFGVFNFMQEVNAAGEFEVTMTTCSNLQGNIEVLGVDEATQQQSAATVLTTITYPLTDVGSISACGNSTTEFVNYTLDGVSYSLTVPGDSLYAFTSGQAQSSYYTYFEGFSTNATTGINFGFTSPSQAAGTYQVTYFSVNNISIDSSRTQTPINIALTNFPTGMGAFYEGSFTGQFVDYTNTNHTVNGTFRIRRRQ